MRDVSQLQAQSHRPADLPSAAAANVWLPVLVTRVYDLRSKIVDQGRCIPAMSSGCGGASSPRLKGIDDGIFWRAG